MSKTRKKTVEVVNLQKNKSMSSDIDAKGRQTTGKRLRITFTPVNYGHNTVHREYIVGCHGKK